MSDVYSNHFSVVNLRKVYEERLAKAKFVGLDGLTANAFTLNIDREIDIISSRALSGDYKFTRYREKLIIKSARKPPRQISIPTIRDALTLRVLCNYLMETFSDSRMSPPHSTVKGVAEAVKRAPPDSSFLRIDVVDFYPSIDHIKLATMLERGGIDPRALSLVVSAISNPTGFGASSSSKVGVPQGLSISNILSMIYMKDFDTNFDKKSDYFRYVDDILFVTEKGAANNLYNEVSRFLFEQLLLQSHPLSSDLNSKTTISDLDSGAEYLGFRISRYEIKIREVSFRKMFRAIMGCLLPLRGTARVEQVLWKLNLTITGCRFEGRSVGWVFFFRQATDVKQFHRMDSFLAKQMVKHGLIEQLPRVKSFVKAYHEVRYNRSKTDYIPDFDNFTLADKIKAISTIRGDSTTNLAVRSRSEIDEIFFSIIRKQVAKLERETVDFGKGYY